jgi:predicted methyltransferase
MRVRRRRTALLAVLVAAALAETGAQKLFPPEQVGSLEGPDREAWQRPEQVMDALRIAEGSAVADLGAGGGWFTMRLANRVGSNGVVYAQDVQPEMIEAITRRVRRANLKQVKTVLGMDDDPRLPAPVDAVLIVDTYHEMAKPVMMLRHVRAALKPNGLIGIIEFKKDGFGPGPPLDERADPERVIRDATAAGLRLKAHETFLRYQYLLVFARQ